tara:strand:- start:32 stop:232 length:201 start_codon:yes stop_codon:yes gene_type:complete
MRDKIKDIIVSTIDKDATNGYEVADKILDLFNVNKCNCPNESTDLYNENGNLLTWGCLHCGFIDRQ